MPHEDIDRRLEQINQTLEAIRSGWPFLLAAMNDRAERLTQSLVNQDNEQTRGRIKQLRELMELPESLAQERDGLSAALAEMAAAD